MSSVSLMGDALAEVRNRVTHRPLRRHLSTLTPAPFVAGCLALAAVYYGAAHLGFAFEFAGPVAAIVWLPAGVGMSFLYLAGLRFWPGVVVGDLLVNNYTALPLTAALGQSIGNLLEIVLAAWLLRGIARSRPPLSSVQTVMLTVGALACGAAVSATIGVTSLSVASGLHGAFPRVWRTWLLGDLTGALIVVPLAIAWLPWRLPSWPRPRLVEGALILAAVIAVSALVNGVLNPFDYLVFPMLGWAALRFEQRGATVATVIVAGFTIWGTTHFNGPFAIHPVSRAVLNTQLFLDIAVISTLTLAALVSQLDALTSRLHASRARLITASQTERRQLERDLHDGAQQRLVALAAHLHLSAAKVKEDPSRGPELFDAAGEELQLAIEELRTLSHGIHPWALSRWGLAGALRDLSGMSAIPVQLGETPRERLPDATESTAYFVIAEAVTNANKHSGASMIRVDLRVQDGLVVIEVADDGVGGAAEGRGLGLQGLRDRVEGIGGVMQVRSRPGSGTRIVAEIPASLQPSDG